MIEAEGLRLLILHNGNDGNPRFNRHDGSARFERQHIRIRLIPRAFGKNTDFLAVFQAFEGIHNRADVAAVTADFYGFQMLAEKSHEPVMHHRFFGNVMNPFPSSARGINDVPYPIMIADINASPVRNFSLAVKPKRQTQPKNRNDDNSAEHSKGPLYDVPFYLAGTVTDLFIFWILFFSFRPLNVFSSINKFPLYA